MHPSEDKHFSIDVHGNTERTIIKDNHAEGIVCAGINSTIKDNELTGEENYPLITVLQEKDSDYYDISGNKLRSLNAGVRAIVINPNVDNLNIKRLSITDNVGVMGGGCVQIQPRNSGITGCSITKVYARGNSFNAGVIASFTIQNNGAGTYAIGEFLSKDNDYKASAQNGFFSDAVITQTKSIDDTFSANLAGSNPATFSGTTVYIENPNFIGNSGGAGNSRSIQYDNTGKVAVINPRFSGIDIYRAESASITEYEERGFTGTTPGISKPSAARVISGYAASGIALAYSTAAPTTGTWAVGDRVENNTPAVGQPKAWRCTVAGTPGTWVSEGNL
jgi:hypothetical protein